MGGNPLVLPMTTLKRQATEILNQPQNDREPIVITRLLEGIARGEMAIEEGRSLTHKQAKQRMSKWLTYPPTSTDYSFDKYSGSRFQPVSIE